MSHYPLHDAAESGDLDKARELLDTGKYNVNNTGGFYEESPLHHACHGGHLDMVRMLISEFKADMNIVTNTTPLHVAAATGREDVGLALINEFGCDTNIISRDGRTVLHCACAGGCVALVRTLIRDHNADVNPQDDINYTPLHYAAQNGQKDVALALINEFGCDLNIRNSDGSTFLHVACKDGSVNIVKSVGKCISPLVSDHDGNTPLHKASEGNQSECVEALLLLNAPIMVRNASGKTSRDLATNRKIKSLLDPHIQGNKIKMYTQIQEHAKKKYSTAEPIHKTLCDWQSWCWEELLCRNHEERRLFPIWEGVRIICASSHCWHCPKYLRQ